jgi:hypothetical protein
VHAAARHEQGETLRSVAQFLQAKDWRFNTKYRRIPPPRIATYSSGCFTNFFAIESNNSATVCFFASGSLGLLYPPPPALL